MVPVSKVFKRELWENYFKGGSEKMRKGTKRLISFVMAGVMTFSGVVLNGGGGRKRNVVEAAATAKYDSASQINYATVLGGAVDYGIVANEVNQRMHMETTFATNKYTNYSGNNDVDYITSTALFLIGALGEAPSNEDSLPTSWIRWGKSTASAMYLEAPQEVFGSLDPETTDARYFDPTKAAQDGTRNGNIIYDSQYGNKPLIQAVNANASSNVNRLISRIGETPREGYTPEDADLAWSYYLQSRANDPEYVLNPNGWDCEYFTNENGNPFSFTPESLSDGTAGNNGKLNINLDSDEFKDKVVYINIDPIMVKYLKRASDFIVHKDPSTVVVFNINENIPTNGKEIDAYDKEVDMLTLIKPIVEVGGVEYDGTTATNGGNLAQAAAVQSNFNETIIWNIMTENPVRISQMGGAMLIPKSDYVEIKDGNSSGWIVTGATVEVRDEFHFLYGGSSQDSYGQMHFSLTKSFTDTYATQGEVVKNPSINVKKDDYRFLLQEYEDKNNQIYVEANKYGTPITKLVDGKSAVNFSSFTFYCENYDSLTDEQKHYYIEKPTGDTPNSKTFYFRVTEDPSKTVPGIENSDGYIDITLIVDVDKNGKFTYFVNYKSVTGKNDPNGENIVYRNYAEKGPDDNDYHDYFIKMSGVQFDLGQFYNKTNVGSIKLTKTFKFYDNYSNGWQEAATAPELTKEQKELIVFTITGPNNFTKTVKYSEFDADGTYTLANVPVGGQYTITETGQDTANLIGDGYVYHPYTTNPGSDIAHSSNPVVTVNSVSRGEVSNADGIKNSYVKLDDRSGTLVIKKKATLDGAAYTGTYKVAVKNSEGKYLQSMPVAVKDQYNQITGYNVSFEESAKYFDVDAGDQLEIIGLPSGNYKVYENDVLVDDTTVKVNNQSVTSDGEVEVANGNVTLNADRKTVTINNDYTYDTGKIKIVKVFKDSEGQEIQNPGNFSSDIVFTYGKTGETGTDVTYNTNTNMEYTVPVGNYSVSETIEEGSTLVSNNDTYILTGSEVSPNTSTAVTKDETTTFTVTNTYRKAAKATIKVKKSDENGNAVHGAKFELKNSNNTVIQTDGYGDVEWTWSNLTEGDYTITETEAGKQDHNWSYVNYNAIAGTINFTIDSDGNVSVKSGTTLPSGVTLDTSSGNVFTVINRVSTTVSLTVTKTVNSDSGTIAAKNYSFRVKNSENKYVNRANDGTITYVDNISDATAFVVNSGNATGEVIEGLEKDTYLVEEILDSTAYPMAVAGYTFNTTSSTTTVPNINMSAGNGEAKLINNYNEITTDVIISKIISGGGNELAGAKLTLTSNDDNTIDITKVTLGQDTSEGGVNATTAQTTSGTSFTWTSGTAPTTIGSLSNGSYTLSEDTAPLGYDCASAITFYVKDGKVYSDSGFNTEITNKTIVMEDAPEDTGSLSVKKIVTGENFNADLTFPVTITLTHASKPMDRTFSVTGYTQNTLGFIGGSQNTTASATIYIKHNQTVVISGIPVGTTYTVTEGSLSGDNYTGYEIDSTTPYTFSNTNTTKSITKDTEDAVTVNNTYTAPGPDTASLTITKTFANGSAITAADITTTGKLTFTVASTTLNPAYSQTFDYTSFTNGSKTISDLKPDTYTVTETSTVEGSNYTRTTTVAVGTGEAANASSATVGLTAGDAKTVTFTNNYERKTGSLVLKKAFDTTVTDYPTNYESESFKVVVTLTDENNTALSGNATYGSISFINGVSGEITISKNSSVTISGIPYGYHYSVVESAPTAAGYSIKTGTDSGTINASTQDATVTNTYTAPGPDTASLTITKTFANGSAITAADITTTGKLTFTVASTTLNPAYSQTFDYTSFTNGSKTISDLKPDTYTVTETSTVEGSNYTRTTTVAVGTGEAANASSATVGLTAGDAKTVTFTNNYERKTGSLVLKKAFDTTVTDYPTNYESESFKVVVTLTDENNTALSGNATYGSISFINGVSGEITISKNSSVTISGIPYGYHYSVVESAPTAAGYSIKTGTDSGTISASTQDATVTNTYTYTAPISVKLTATKNYVDANNNPLTLSAGKFTFALSGPKIDNTQSKTNDADGDIVFDDIIFTSDDINNDPYIYTISEVTPTGVTVGNNTLNGMTYDMTIYKAYVVISKDNSGALTAAVTYKKVTGIVPETVEDVQNITFTNKYTAPEGKIVVTKVDSADNTIKLSGASFKLYGSETGDDQVGDEKTTGEDGTVTFENLETEKTYYLLETKAPNENYEAPSTTRIAVEVTGTVGTDNVVTVNQTVKNTKKDTPQPTTGKLTLTKTFGGDITEEEVLHGSISFIVKCGDKYLDKDGNLVDTETEINITDLTTHENGTLMWSKTFDVPFGEYTVTEKNTTMYIKDGNYKAPFTFVSEQSKTTATGTVSATADKTLELVNYYSKPVVKISKIDATGKQEIDGAQLELYSSDDKGNKVGDFSKTWTSSSKHVESFVLPAGTYTIKETVAPEGYEKQTNFFIFKVEYDKDDNLILTQISDDHLPGTYDVKTGLISFENDPIKVTGKLSVHVVEEKTGDDVPNAVVRITGPDGFDETYTTNDKGEIVDKDGKTPIEVPAGTYKVTIVEVPEGYEVTTGEVGEVVVPENGEARHEAKIIPKEEGTTTETTTQTTETTEDTKETTTEITTETDDLGNLIITVTEVETGRVVPGATVEVVYPDGTTKTFVTDDNGQITLKDIPVGDYSITVKKVPDGYTVTTGETAICTVTAGATTEHEAKIVTKTGTDGVDTTDTVVKTDDPTNTMPFMIAMLISCAGIVFFAGRKRKLNK